MKYSIVITKNAEKDLSRLDSQIKKRIKGGLEFFLSQHNPLMFARRLVKPKIGTYRWRVGMYRIVFDVDVDKGVIVILSVQHRREVYKK